MALMRRQDVWDPFRELEEIGTRFQRLFGVTKPGEMEREVGMTAWAPACDIVETDKEYRIRLELPDVKKEDLHITMERGMLTIRGERRETREEDQGKFHRRELQYGTFLRRFTLPDDVDPDKIDAICQDGMLTVAIPKSEASETQAREIAIH